MKDLAIELLELEDRLAHPMAVVNLSRQLAPEVPFEPRRDGESAEEVVARYQAHNKAYRSGGLQYCLAVGLMSCPKMFLSGPDAHELVAQAHAILDDLSDAGSPAELISWGSSIEAVLATNGVGPKEVSGEA